MKSRLAGEALTKLNAEPLESLRALYVEVTGREAIAHELSPAGLIAEIRDKAPEGEVQEVFARLSAELAGKAAPPPPGARTSPLERLLRLQIELGDRFERELAAELGPARARALRAAEGGWSSRSSSGHGCPPPEAKP